MITHAGQRGAVCPALRGPFRGLLPPGCRTLLLAAAVLLPSVPALASNPAGPALVSIAGIDQRGVRREVFSLAGSTPLWVRAEGAGDADGKSLLAAGWILDLNSLKPVWTMEGVDGSLDRKTGDWIAEGPVTLPAGTYAVYFSATDGTVSMNQNIRVFGMDIGRIEGNFGRSAKWDDRGKPSHWGIRVQAAEAGYAPLPAPAEVPMPWADAVVRLLGLRDRTVERVRLDLAHAVKFDVHFTGEYSRAAQDFADAAWITDRSDWRPVWIPAEESCRPAGGAEKNRRFDGTVSLPAGSYLVTVATDASHAVDDWNAPPPWDPEAWGLAMRIQDPQDRAAVRITPRAGLPDPVITIDRVGNNACLRRPFTVARTARVLLRGYGERSNESGMADFGWIDRIADMAQVWSMQDSNSAYGGGAKKNRMVDEVITLAPGAYDLCYATDDSHAFNHWNSEEPWEPEAWGVTLSELPERPGSTEEIAPGHGAVKAGAAADAPLMLTLAPARSGEERIKSFDVTSAVRVLVVAMGESDDQEMVDYGWISNDATGAKVWEMTYGKTHHAGGAVKNRVCRQLLDLPKGSYSMHFVTDDSHAFGDWNDTPPDQPQLWGLTLVEQQ